MARHRLRAPFSTDDLAEAIRRIQERGETVLTTDTERDGSWVLYTHVKARKKAVIEVSLPPCCGDE